ncbi:TRAP transporter TatT component family protein, partial [Thermodesulfobacteriota bacterium]
AGEGMAAQLKFMEGLLKSAQGNKQLLTALSMGYAGYALLFVEDMDQERASRLYARAQHYGALALNLSPDTLRGAARDGHGGQMLRGIGKKELPALFWTTLAWNAWIRLNLDKPAAVAELAPAEACLERILELDAEYFHGAPQVLAGSFLAAKPGLLGGESVRAREFFESALRSSDGKFFLTQYYYARYYAVRAQDRELFETLLEDMQEAPPEGLKDVCLINTAMQQKAKSLLTMADDLFY